jgi:GT2 family glycosyltransferase
VTEPDGRGPEVSVLLPAYRSEATIARCLEALARQTYRDFEVLVVDSDPGAATEHTVRASFPWVLYEHSPRRLLPHAARNRGVERARGDLLVFSDPDCYARPDWLARLVATHRETGGVVVGAIACFGAGWRETGIHLCKFSKWLPAGAARPLDMSPTANMLLSRRDFAAAAGFPGGELLGDVTLSRRLRELGHELRFEPRAVVEHHHTQSVGAFLAERYERGRLFGQLRAAWLGERRWAIAFYLAVTLLPIRLARILTLVARDARRAAQAGRYLTTLPLVAAGHAASLAGEAAAYVRRLAAFRSERG